ncbi:MAG: hypothetical protein ROY99_15490 [Ignavibacterium sp.]|nr:hypothetical protein [Ignavibacterium sp.]
MKNKIQMIIFIITQLTGIILAQNLNQTEIDSIINDLYSDDWTVVDNATIDIIYNNITEALPILRDNFWNQSLNSRISYLEAMKVLQSQETLSYSLALFDTLQIKTYQGIDTVYKKLYLIDELFDLGDFSKIDYLDYCANNSMSKSNLELCIQLWSRLLSFPNYSLLAKNRLLEFIQLDRYWEVRYKAMSWLEDYYMAELSQLMINRYHQEDNDVIKFNIIRKYTHYGDFETVANLLKYILVNDTDTICKQIAYEKLLTEYRTPSNYVYVISWLNDEGSYSEFKRLNKVYEEYICPGTPFQPDSTISIKEIIDTTSSYVSQSIMYYWLGDLSFSNEIKNILTTAKTNLQNGDSLACRVQVKAFQDLVDNVYKDSLNSDPRFVTIEGWKFLYWNAQYILDRLPEPPANPNLLVNLKNSLGNQIPASNVKYYEGSWKDAVNNGDGTFTVITTKPTVSIRMFYEYANQTVHNITAHNNTYTFHTVNASVELRNSSGNLMDAGTVQYYAGAWRTFGTTQNGVAHKELLPINYSFRMTYEYVPLDKQQDISTNSTVTFSTVLCTLKVTKANGQPLSGAGTKYYSGAWRDIGLTNTNGEATKELLPKSLNFRATSGNVNKDKQQDIGLNSLVEIQLNVP